MATTTPLTERQKQIQTLLDQDLTPPQIAKKLKISDNAVYQQLKRMRERNGASASPRPARRRSPAASRPAASRPLLAGTATATTPLQAIRGRRDAINRELRSSGDALAGAEAAAKRQAEGHAKLKARYEGELKQLAAAERALSKPASTRKRPAKSGSASGAASGGAKS